jgi:hypothetical protein
MEMISGTSYRISISKLGYGFILALATISGIIISTSRYFYFIAYDIGFIIFALAYVSGLLAHASP